MRNHKVIKSQTENSINCALNVFDKDCTVDQKAGPFLPRRNLVTLFESDRKKWFVVENLAK